MTTIGATSNSTQNASFYKCSNLRSITLHELVTRIGFNAFRETGLTSISGLGFVKIINDNAFYNTTSLTIEDLSLPNLETLGQDAFYGVKIRKISNLGKITALNNKDFMDNKTLEEIYLPDSLVTIAGTDLGGNIGAFYNCSSLKTVVLGKNITTIKHATFSGCSSLAQINLEGVTSIEGGYYTGAFSYAFTPDYELNAPNLETITYHAFQKAKLKKVVNLGKVAVLGSSGDVNYGGLGTFYECPNLEFLTYSRP